MFKKGKKRIITSLFLTIALLSSVFMGCGSKEASTSSTKEVAKGFQWEVKNGDKTMYLIGTMHPINKEYDYFSESIKNIVDKTDVLAVEVNPTQEEALVSNASLVYSNGKTIEDDLNEKEIEKLKAITKDAGLDYEKIKVLKAVGIVNNIQAVMYDKAGLSMETFDDMLMKDVNSKKKKVIQLETLDFQMKLLEKINGIDALKQSLNEYKVGEFESSSKEAVDYSKGLMDGYLKGEEKVMNDAIEIQKQDKKSYDLMIKNRNIDMVKKIEGFFKEDKTYTIAVGALHFFGEDGIVEMLKEKGYEVNKI